LGIYYKCAVALFEFGGKYRDHYKLQPIEGLMIKYNCDGVMNDVISRGITRRDGAWGVACLMAVASATLPVQAALINLGDGGKVASQTTTLNSSFAAGQAING